MSHFTDNVRKLERLQRQRSQNHAFSLRYPGSPMEEDVSCRGLSKLKREL
jgi:hypothetical protein